jgi:hypothetical protein
MVIATGARYAKSKLSYRPVRALRSGGGCALGVCLVLDRLTPLQIKCETSLLLMCPIIDGHMFVVDAGEVPCGFKAGAIAVLCGMLRTASQF